jgi:hypothetical protein
MATSGRGLAGTDTTSRTIWMMVAFIILNHLILDPVLTVYRKHTGPGGYELNPVWRELIRSDPGVFLLFQLPMIAIVIGGYWLLFRFIKQEQPPWDARIAKGLWYGSLLVACWGVFSTFHHLWFLAQRIG